MQTSSITSAPFSFRPKNKGFNRQILFAAANSIDRDTKIKQSPKQNRFVIRTIQTALHHTLKLFLGFKVDIKPGDIKEIQRLVKSGKKVIIAPNHVIAAIDVLALLELSRLTALKGSVVAKGAEKKSFIAALLRAFGAFPADGHTVETSAKVLLSSDTVLAIFPSGRRSMLSAIAGNSRTGLARIAQHVAKSGAEVVIIPVGLRYTWKQPSISSKLEKQLRRAEFLMLGTKKPTNQDREQRIQAVFEAFVDERAQFYRVSEELKNIQNPLQRLAIIIDTVIDGLEKKYELPQDKDLSSFKRVRHIQQLIKDNPQKKRDLVILRDLTILLDYLSLGSFNYADDNEMYELTLKMIMDYKHRGLGMLEHLEPTRGNTMYLRLGEAIRVLNGDETESAEQLTQRVEERLQTAIEQVSKEVDACNAIA